MTSALTRAPSPAQDATGRLRWVLAAILAGHLALLAFGIADPDASLRFDRTGRRSTSARMLLESADSGSALQVLRSRGAPGDYAWHAAVLGPSGGSLPAVQIVQLLLAGLSLVAVYRIVRVLDGRPKAAWLAVVIYAAIPIDFMVPHFLASEAFFNPLWVLGTAAVVHYATARPDLRTIGLAGAAFGLGVLTRTEGLPWLIVMFALTTAIVIRVARPRTVAHLGLLAALCFGGVGVHLAMSPTEPVRLDHATLSVGWELANRAHRVIAAAGGDVAGIEAEPVAAFARAVLEHPLAFAREWALQAGKLLALPDNLDLPRYLGAYEYTGRRSEWVHDLGVVGAVRRVFSEMPGLATWLCATVLLWLGVLGLAVRGAVDVLRRSAGVERLLYLLLLSLPFVWVLLRVLAQGESRKRSPVDFAIAIFAALGWMRARYTPREHESTSDGVTSEGDG
jgi:4-amino-4-deoxy-L-arabinose transferase-like glycosyltransferase